MAEAVRSVLAQTHEDWRLVIGEDGPGSQETADAVTPFLSDDRISYAPAGSPLGPAANMTRLLAAGKAPFVAILHDDDLWAPAFLARRMAFLEEHPRCAYVFSAHVDIDPEGREVGRSHPSLAEGAHPPEEFVPKMLCEDIVDTPTVLVRRSAWDSAGAYFDERFPRLYDWEAMLRLALGHPVGFLHQWDAAYRTHGHQSSLSGGRGEEFLQITEHMDELVKRAAPGLRLTEGERRRVRAGHHVSAALDELERGEKKAGLRHLGHALKSRRRVVLDRRFAPALLGLIVGRWLGRAIASARASEHARRRRPDMPLESGGDASRP